MNATKSTWGLALVSNGKVRSYFDDASFCFFDHGRNKRAAVHLLLSAFTRQALILLIEDNVPFGAMTRKRIHDRG